ncbi:hypothetical protein DRA42_05440 [Ethanoligenens harbinense]|nr:hypothetical protein CXQ68_05425 [Ethanoligenens harbinense YUAN-3]AYF38388.1 hypothetical protein CXP51_05285 [Ethanoligenens harbinense]AYF41133.1 hypothetical protein CN246_05420 [Ethanoligenens harbinense]QCN91964.1 hypothetical protein DRA42_05440 [Ethanoligenens harbinense]
MAHFYKKRSWPCSGRARFTAQNRPYYEQHTLRRTRGADTVLFLCPRIVRYHRRHIFVQD